MNTYLPFNEEFEPKTDDFINGLLKNPGFAIDIGAHFELPADFGIAFSINDLGTILWSNDRLTNSFSFTTNDTGKFIKEGSIFFDGFEVSLKGIQDGQMHDINTVLDSISADDFITYSYARRDVYRTPLYPKLYLEFSINYQIIVLPFCQERILWENIPFLLLLLLAMDIWKYRRISIVLFHL